MVPNKFCLVILSENEDVNVREMFSSFCKKFRINRFEPNFCIRSSQKSVEEKVNLSKYHLFLSVVENKMDEVRLYGQEQCYNLWLINLQPRRRKISDQNRPARPDKNWLPGLRICNTGQENSPFLLQKDHNGKSLLHIAASYGHVSIQNLVFSPFLAHFFLFFGIRCGPKSLEKFSAFELLSFSYIISL